MDPNDRQRLLDLVPELRDAAIQATPRTLDEVRANVTQLQIEVKQALAGQHLLAETPFLGDLTLGQYLNLPENERAQLWEDWTELELEELEERDLKIDPMST
jgi:hypothetical protein